MNSENGELRMEKLRCKKKKPISSDSRRTFYTIYWLEKAKTAIVGQYYADFLHDNVQNRKTGGRIILPIAVLSRTQFAILQGLFSQTTTDDIFRMV